MSYTGKVDRYGIKRYYKNGKLHRDGDEPAFIDSYGAEEYWKNGERHRDGDQPAYIWSDGYKEYWKNGERHRDGDQPAIIDSDGAEEYWKNGELHRDGDEPAVIYSDGTKRYYKNGVKYTKEQVEKMEEIRRRILNRNAKSCARYWYDKTYMNPINFKARMVRDMDVLENDIGYKLC